MGDGGWGWEGDDEIRLLVNYGRPGGAKAWDGMDASKGC